MTTIEFTTAETERGDEVESIQTWVAEYASENHPVGVGTTRQDALRSLADEMDRRYEAAQRGALADEVEVVGDA